MTRCDGSAGFDITCDDDSDCDGTNEGDCTLPSWDLDSGFPVEVDSDLQAEAADMTIDDYGRIWVVNTEKR